VPVPLWFLIQAPATGPDQTPFLCGFRALPDLGQAHVRELGQWALRGMHGQLPRPFLGGCDLGR
jgi:hypothetical protein